MIKSARLGVNNAWTWTNSSTERLIKYQYMVVSSRSLMWLFIYICQNKELTRITNSRANFDPLVVPRRNYYCPRRVLAQTAKTRGGTLGAPAYRKENFAVPEKFSNFENTARKRLPKVRWGSNKQAKDSGSVLYTTRFWILHLARLCVSFLDQFKLIFWKTALKFIRSRF